MQGNDSWMRKKFREADASLAHDATHVLNYFRRSTSSAEYSAVLSAFRTAAPKTFRSTSALGPRSTSELIWVRPALDAVHLEDELIWAACWLKGHSAKLNTFRRTSVQLQNLILSGSIQSSISLLDSYVKSSGWSFWAVELRTALLQLSAGTGAQRAWLGELQERALNSIPGLLFQIFGDRNDDTFSYEAIYAKCINSFPRFESVAPWLVDYLNFRALANIEVPLKSLPSVLGRDVTSSLIDYYESVVEVISNIECEPILEMLRPAALALVSTLIGDGYQDHRLRKLKFALAADFSSDLDISLVPQPEFAVTYIMGSSDSIPSFLMEINEDLSRCQSEGAAAYDLIGTLVKWGINFKGIDFGAAVAMSALSATSRQSNSRVLPLSAALLSECFCLHDAAAFSPMAATNLLRRYLSKIGHDAASYELYKLKSWGLAESLPEPGPIHLWIAYQLLEQRAFGELAELLIFLKNGELYWERQCAKIEATAFSMQERLDEALKILEDWFRKDYRYALEFPCDVIFGERKWSSFKALDPVEVGLVSHYAFEAFGNAYVGYICKMACRNFLYSGMRSNVVDAHERASGARKAQIVAFLRDVWIEQNLAMCHEFESSADVRIERMSVLQLLLSWENDRATEYAEAIKDLTFDQTLQRGLERIDQTRVFVNESAITRWAEKELTQDFDRWKRLAESGAGGRAIDDMLRQYALDPTNIDVLKEFADGKPTASDALLIDIIDRLFKRFLLDPTDGLDTYLSVRIRHGSLRGTILGPLEEQGLLYSAAGFSQEAFAARWDDVLRLPHSENTELLASMQDFSNEIRMLVDEFVEQRVQVVRPEKPHGAFPQVIHPLSAKMLAALLAERPTSFHAFICSNYFVFWKLVELGLNQLRLFIDEQLAEGLRNRIDTLIKLLRLKGHKYLPLITTLTTVSTMTKSQCDAVSEWFRLPSMVSGERYQLPDAIEIASAATKNVYRSFPAEVQVKCLPSVALPLTTSALAVLMDCLFVIFENAWKHSGLGNDLPPINLLAEFDPESTLLTFEARSNLSHSRLACLINGELIHLRAKYLGELPLELISLEGGSGFPKLARLTRTVSREICAQPFDFGVQDDGWFTRISVPLYEREGAYEAFE